VAVSLLLTAPPLGQETFAAVWSTHRCSVSCPGPDTPPLSEREIPWPLYPTLCGHAGDDAVLCRSLFDTPLGESPTARAALDRLLAVREPSVALTGALVEVFLDVGLFSVLLLGRLGDAERGSLARMVLTALDNHMVTPEGRPSARWLASELAALLPVEDRVRHVPFGLLMRPRSFPVAACGVPDVRRHVAEHLGDDVDRLDVFLRLGAEWTGSLEDLTAAAASL